eukprot:7396015-Heterocapsa_arctica.AAC.1
MELHPSAFLYDGTRRIQKDSILQELIGRGLKRALGEPMGFAPTLLEGLLNPLTPDLFGCQ